MFSSVSFLHVLPSSQYRRCLGWAFALKNIKSNCFTCSQFIVLFNYMFVLDLNDLKLTHAFNVCNADLGDVLRNMSSISNDLMYAYSVPCSNICASSGIPIPYGTQISRYTLKSRSFKCSLPIHRKAFYCSANAIFGKVGRIASEEVVLQQVNKKCLPSLLYGLEACPL